MQDQPMKCRICHKDVDKDDAFLAFADHTFAHLSCNDEREDLKERLLDA